MTLTLNNPRRLICHQTKKPIIHTGISRLVQNHATRDDDEKINWVITGGPRKTNARTDRLFVRLARKEPNSESKVVFFETSCISTSEYSPAPFKKGLRLVVLFHGILSDTIYQTPPLGQDMTQGQFLSGV